MSSFEVVYCICCALPLATPLSGRPLAVLSVNCRHILLYNLGLQHLFMGRPVQAFDYLLEAVQVFHCNPQLWLRLAEACVAAHCVVRVHAVRDRYSGRALPSLNFTSQEVT